MTTPAAAEIAERERTALADALSGPAEASALRPELKTWFESLG